MEAHFTVEEAAESLGVSTRTIYSYLKEGKLSGRKKGNRLHIPKKEVEQIKAPSIQYNPETQIVIERTEYEELAHAKAVKQDYEMLRKNYDGLLVKLGQLEAEVRFTKEENQKLLEDMRYRKQAKNPWWKRMLGYGKLQE